MENEIARPPGDVEYGSAGLRGMVPPVAARPRRSWWLLTVLTVYAALIPGAGVAPHPGAWA
jgi:hypothetical protein